MSDKSSANASRRDFLKDSGRLAGAAALVGAAGRHVYAEGDETIRVALVGCGGRGTGAADNAMKVEAGRVELVAMADVFDDRQSTSFNALKGRHADKFKVTDDTRFIGFDAYKKAMDVLRPGDIVILTTPVAFRWVHYSYAIEKGLNVFMEKPIATEGPTTRKMLELNKKAIEKNLKVGVGLMCRHCLSRGEAAKRVHDGEIGDVLNIRAYRMAGPTASAATGPAPDGMGDLEWQIRRFHAFLWASGGAVSDFLIHNIDEGCWLKGAWPVQAKGSGGRHYRGDMIDQNFDSYSIEYTFEDGTKLNVDGRTIAGCHQDFATYAQGSKGSVVFSTAGHLPAKSRIYSGYKVDKGKDGTDPGKLVWEYGKPEPNPYQVEWEDIVTAIKNDTPYNEVERGAMASLVTAMGRHAAHTGQVITLDEMMNHEHEFAPDADKLVLGGPAPLAKLPNGKYPVPMPGITKKREY